MFGASVCDQSPRDRGARGLPLHSLRQLAAVLTGLTLLLPACSEKQPPAEPEEPALAAFDLDAIDWRSRVPEADRGTRYDSPWYWLTDAELSAAVAAAGGRVSIGFKDPSERGGVDEEGRVICSPASEAAGRKLLRDLGLVFEFEFLLVPAVTLTVPVELVPVIRSNPLIDYIEPVLPGVRAG